MLRDLVLVSFAAAQAGGCTSDPADPARTPPEPVVDSGTGPTVGTTPEPTTVSPPVGGNLLVVIADDVGIDSLALYGLGGPHTATPRLDQLAAEGVRFQSAYANPVCSASRATIQTGRYGWRTGITGALHLGMVVELAESELTIAELLGDSEAAYATSYFGKWHLGSVPGTVADHPNLMGWDHYEGSLNGFSTDAAADGLPQGYHDWVKTVDGEWARTTKYATTATADDAISVVGQPSDAPWLVVVAFNSAHTPYHWPPASLSSTEVPDEPPPRQKYLAMVEAMDTELGRVLDAIPSEERAETTVVFVGDNGTPHDVMAASLGTLMGKGSSGELGSHVPMIVTGPWVTTPGATTAALVNTTDLFATLAEIAGVAIPDGLALDSQSFAPCLVDPAGCEGRAFAYAEDLHPVGLGPYVRGFHTIRDERWKLVEEVGKAHALYDLQGALIEGEDLLLGSPSAEALAAYDRLLAALPFRL